MLPANVSLVSDSARGSSPVSHVRLTDPKPFTHGLHSGEEVLGAAALGSRRRFSERKNQPAERLQSRHVRQPHVPFFGLDALDELPQEPQRQVRFLLEAAAHSGEKGADLAHGEGPQTDDCAYQKPSYRCSPELPP